MNNSNPLQTAAKAREALLSVNDFTRILTNCLSTVAQGLSNNPSKTQSDHFEAPTSFSK